MSTNIYTIPLLPSTLTIPYSDPYAHSGILKHSVDFVIDYNVAVCAALEGIVVDVKDNATEGGPDLKYTAWKYQNLVTIKHTHDEITQYGHLAQNSALVKVGDKVHTGQPIATGIDMIGCTTAPHVHFMVIKVVDNQPGFTTIPISWNTPLEVLTTEEQVDALPEHFDRLVDLLYSSS